MSYRMSDDAPVYALIIVAAIAIVAAVLVITVIYGRLVIGVFDDDLPGGPIEIIEVKA